MADSERRKAPLWLETVVLLTVAVVLALIIKTLFVQAFYIPSSSMRPGLVINDRILVQKVSYWFGGRPQRGDVVVFADPGGWLPQRGTAPANPVTRALSAIGLYPSGGHLVKRVVGVEGDVIECCDRQGRLEINGAAVEGDGFLAQRRKCDGPMPSGCERDWSVGPIPDGQLFVMGDNRASSFDSSGHMCKKNDDDCDESEAFVPEDLVVGKVFALVWPLDHVDWIGRPEAFDEIPEPSGG